MLFFLLLDFIGVDDGSSFEAWSLGRFETVCISDWLFFLDDFVVTPSEALFSGLLVVLHYFLE